MAKYRQVHVHIWKDGWFLDLDPKHKLFFIYLFTNERASISGIYELSKRVMSFESGLSFGEIDDALQAFEQEGKAYYDDGVVWVPNLRKYHESKSPKVVKFIEDDVSTLKDCKLKSIYCGKYSIDTVFSVENTVSSRDSASSSVSSGSSSKTGGKPKLPPIPSYIATPALMNAWGEWCQYNEDKGHPLVFRTAKGQHSKFENWGEARSIAAIEHSMDNGYKGLIEPKDTDKGRVTRQSQGLDAVHRALGDLHERLLRQRKGHHKITRFSSDAISALPAIR
jgi:hypothetical protein